MKKEGAHDAKFERRHDAVMDAASAIIDTEPTTILGATARLRYVVKHESAGNTFDFIDDDDGKTKPWTFVVMHNTADALEKMTAGA